MTLIQYFLLSVCMHAQEDCEVSYEDDLMLHPPPPVSAATEAAAADVDADAATVPPAIPVATVVADGTGEKPPGEQNMTGDSRGHEEERREGAGRGETAARGPGLEYEQKVMVMLL